MAVNQGMVTRRLELQRDLYARQAKCEEDDYLPEVIGLWEFERKFQESLDNFRRTYAWLDANLRLYQRL